MNKILLVFLTNFSSACFAFTLITPQLKGWDTKNLEFHLNLTNCPANYHSLIENSMNLWNSIPNTNLRLSLGPDSTATVVQATSFTAAEAAVIVCDPAYATTFAGAGGNAGNGSSLTNSQNRIYQGRVVLNLDSTSSGYMLKYPEIVIRIILAHEIGHVLGLGHSSDTAALMYYSSGYKSDFTLSEDDINGVTYLYGRNEISGDQLLGGCALVDNLRRGGRGPLSVTNLFALLVLLCMPLAVWNNRRIAT